MYWVVMPAQSRAVYAVLDTGAVLVLFNRVVITGASIVKNINTSTVSKEGVHVYQGVDASTVGSSV